MLFNYEINTVYLSSCLSTSKMNRNDILKRHQKKLDKRYKQLIEQAYNFRQTDHALSDISEYKAIKLLDKLNKLKYLSREVSHALS